MRSSLEIDLEHLDLDEIPHLDDVAGMVDVLPRELDVDQAVHAAEVDERPEVDHRRNGALTDLTRLEVCRNSSRLLAQSSTRPGGTGPRCCGSCPAR